MTIGRITRTASLLAAACVAATACSSGGSPASPSPFPSSGCAIYPQKVWAVRLISAGRTMWRTPIQGWKARVTMDSSDLPTPPSPVVSGDVAVVPDGNSVTGLRLSDGRVLWRWASPKPVAELWQWRGRVVVLTSGNPDSDLTGLRAMTGTVAWKLPVSAGRSGGEQAETGDGELMLDNPVAGTVSPDGNPLGNLEAVRLSDGSVRWHHATGGDAWALAAAGGTVVAETGGRSLTGYDDRTGVVRWKSSGYPLSLGLTALNDHSVAVNMNPDDDSPPGPPRVIDSRTGQPSGTLRASEYAASSTARVGPDSVTLQDSSTNGAGPNMPNLVRADASTGAVRWSRPVSPATHQQPVLSGRDVDIVTDIPAPAAAGQAPRDDHGQVLAYRADTGQPDWKASLPAAAPATPAAAPGGLITQAGSEQALCG